MRRAGRCSLHSGEGMKELGSGDKHSAACRTWSWQPRRAAGCLAGEQPCGCRAGACQTACWKCTNAAICPPYACNVRVSIKQQFRYSCPVIRCATALYSWGRTGCRQKIANAIKYLSGTLTASVRHSGVRCPSWLDLLRNP